AEHGYASTLPFTSHKDRDGSKRKNKSKKNCSSRCQYLCTERVRVSILAKQAYCTSYSRCYVLQQNKETAEPFVKLLSEPLDHGLVLILVIIPPLLIVFKCDSREGPPFTHEQMDSSNTHTHLSYTPPLLLIAQPSFTAPDLFILPSSHSSTPPPPPPPPSF
ncbi:max dimerization protein 1 isoform X1, partial [Tachysurus ichikawai]